MEQYTRDEIIKNFELKQCKLCLCSKWINKNETICNRCKENMKINLTKNEQNNKN